MSGDESEALMRFLEAVAPFVAMVSGVRAQFIEQGWTPVNAEAMAVELFRMQNRGAAS